MASFDPENYFTWLKILISGRALGYSLLENNGVPYPVENRLKEYTFRNLKALDKSHFSQTNFCLPISLALHLGGLHDQKLHELAHSILHEIGSYVRAHHMFLRILNFLHICNRLFQKNIVYSTKIIIVRLAFYNLFWFLIKWQYF